MSELENLEEGELPSEELIQSLADAGFAGVEPGFFPPRWQAPEDALDGLNEQQARDGLSAFVTLTALPSGLDMLGSTEELENLDVEIAYKRFPVSSNPDPNINPVLNSLQINGEDYSATDTFVAQAGEKYEIEPIFPEDSVQTYGYLNPDGVEEERTEEPYFTWYLEAGTFDQPFTLHPYNTVEWTAPNESHEGQIVAVMRDRRGGMAWASLHVRVEK